ncbi:MAG: hypothetical protein ACFFBD_10620, partial [Candidatus Hodarchaeota archaeon]
MSFDKSLFFSTIKQNFFSICILVLSFTISAIILILDLLDGSYLLNSSFNVFILGIMLAIALNHNKASSLRKFSNYFPIKRVGIIFLIYEYIFFLILIVKGFIGWTEVEEFLAGIIVSLFDALIFPIFFLSKIDAVLIASWIGIQPETQPYRVFTRSFAYLLSITLGIPLTILVWIIAWGYIRPIKFNFDMISKETKDQDQNSNYRFDKYIILMFFFGFLIRFLPWMIAYPGIPGYDIPGYILISHEMIDSNAYNIFGYRQGLIYLGVLVHLVLKLDLAIIFGLLSSIFSTLTGIMLLLIVRSLFSGFRHVRLYEFCAITLWLISYTSVAPQISVINQTFGVFLLCIVFYSLIKTNTSLRILQENVKNSKGLLTTFIYIALFFISSIFCLLSHPFVAITLILLCLSYFTVYTYWYKSLPGLFLTSLGYLSVVIALIVIFGINDYFDPQGFSFFGLKPIFD